MGWATKCTDTERLTSKQQNDGPQEILLDNESSTVAYTKPIKWFVTHILDINTLRAESCIQKHSHIT